MPTVYQRLNNSRHRAAHLVWRKPFCTPIAMHRRTAALAGFEGLSTPERRSGSSACVAAKYLLLELPLDGWIIVHHGMSGNFREPGARPLAYY